MNTTNYVSVSGGDEKISTLFSFENYNNEGVLNETEGYKRTSIRANIDFNLSDNLKFSASNSFIKIDDLAPGVGAQGYRNITRLSPDSNLTYDNPDGQKYWFTPDPHESEIQNPLYGLATPTLGAKQSRFLGGYNLRYNISSVFTVELEYSFESDNYRYSDSDPYNTFQINSEEPGFGYSKGSLYQNNYYQLAQKAQATLNYRQEFGAFDIKAKLSWLGEDLSYEQFSATGIDYLYAGLPTLDNFKGESITATGDKQAVRASNMFLIAGVTYKEKYILDGLVRRDGSSQFGADERYNNYSRVSAAWRITEDITIPGVQEMKINAAFGTSGQRPGFNWQYEQVSLSNGQLSSNRLKGNSNLKPSKSAETEIGLNVSFLDRFTFEAAHATTETSDQFMLVGLFSPANAGKNRQWQNVGDLEATTIEASLKANVLNTQNMRWDIGVNYATTTNEIKALNAPQQQVGSDNLFLLKEGIEFGSMWGRSFVYDLATMSAQLPDGGSISDYSVNADGLVVETANIGSVDEAAIAKVDENGVAVFEQIGNQNADFRVGMTSNFSYKNIDFYMLWDWKSGGDIYNRNTQWNTISSRAGIVDQAGKPQNEKKTQNYYGSLYDVNRANKFWVEDGSFVKLREVAISYNFSKEMLARTKVIKNAKLSLIGRNILTFTDYTGWDPEVTNYSSGTQQYFSVDYGVYPTQTSYSLAVNKDAIVVDDLFKNLLKSLNTDNIYVGIKATILNQADIILKNGIKIEIEPNIKTTAAGLFNAIYMSIETYYGPGMALNTMADVSSCSWGNVGMRDLSSEPRVAWNNGVAYGNGFITNDFFNALYSSLSDANTLALAVSNGTEFDDTNLINAVAKFGQAITIGYNALIFNKVWLSDETGVVGDAAADYNAAMTFALTKLDEAIAIANANSFTVPNSWFNAGGRAAINFLRSLRDMLAGNARSSINMTVSKLV